MQYGEQECTKKNEFSSYQWKFWTVSESHKKKLCTQFEVSENSNPNSKKAYSK